MNTVHFYDFGEIYNNTGISHDCSKGKFVQIVHEEDGYYLIFSPTSICTYHAQIVNLFCKEHLTHWYFDINEKQDHGQLQVEKATIVGGGYYEIFSEARRLNLHGASLAFGDYEVLGLEEKINSIPRFLNYKVFC